MVDKIIGTFFSRIVTTIIMFIVVIINTNVFGAEGTGTIALVILGLTILQLFSNFVGGGALVYLTPRKSFSHLLFLSYSWSLLSNTLGVILLYYLNFIPEGFEYLLFILSLINSLYYINVTLMQGRENIRTYNYYQISQAFILIFTLAILLCYHQLKNLPFQVELYIYALISSYLIPLFFSYRFIFKEMDKFSFRGIFPLLKEMFKLGIWVQLANLAQLLNYRLNYYLIEFYAGRKVLGLFDLGTKLSEVIWIFPKSIALVQYATLANNEDQNYAVRVTSLLLKIVFCFTLIAVIILLCIPAEVIGAVFGAEFYEAKRVIYCLAPGIVFASCLTIFAHHFSGFGKYWINTTASTIGLCMTLVLGLIFIPRAAEIGYIEAIQTAGVITSISYFSSLVTSFILFFLKTPAKFKDLLISKSDLQLLKKEFSVLRKRFRKKES